MKKFFFLNKVAIIRSSFIAIIVSFLLAVVSPVKALAGFFDDVLGFYVSDTYVQDHVSSFSKYIIGLALAVLIFSVPYLIYLWGSGTPENIKKANQYLTSLIGGLLVVLLGYAILINIIGVGILGINLGS